MINTKKMSKMKSLILIVMLAVTGLGFSQTSENPEECKEKRALITLYAKQKMYRDAANFFEEAYVVCGMDGLERADWNNAKIIFKKLIKAEKDEAVKAGLNDTLIWIYEKGDTYGNDPKWKADYATEFVKQKSKDGEKIDSLYSESIHNLKEKCSTTHIKYYYTHLVRKFNSNDGEEKEAARNFAIDEYLILSDYITIAVKKNITKGDQPRANQYGKAQKFLDQYFVKLADDCIILTEVLGKKLANLPADKANKIEKIKGYLNILDGRKCTDTDVYGQFADSLIALEPTSAAYYAQGNFYSNKKEYSKAKDYFTKAIEMEGEGDNADKYKYMLASTEYSTGSYRSAFRTAKNIEGEYKGKAMIICANAIAKTANSCGDTSFERQANYWLANGYIRKASALGESVSSSTYLSAAPTSEEVFDAGKTMGSSITLKCWNENTTIR